MADIFHEVDEEVRRERLQKLWDRYGIYLIALAVLIVAGVGAWRGYEWWQAKKAAAAGAAFESALSLSEAGKHAEAEAAFAKVAAEAPAGYRVLARLRAAAELAQIKPADAVKAYDELAADNSLGATLQDLAAVRAGMLMVDSAPLVRYAAPSRSGQRTWPHLPPQRARAFGAVGLAQSRLHRRAPLYRHDRDRWREPAGHPRARRGAFGADRRRRQELRISPCAACIASCCWPSWSRSLRCSPVVKTSTRQVRIFSLNEKKKLTGERKELFPGRRAGRDARASARIPERQTDAVATAGDKRRRR